MKQLLLVTAIFMGATARADVQPADVIAPFFDFIVGKIQDNQDNNKVDWIDVDGNTWSDNKVLLQDQGNKILFGNLILDEETGSDSFTLPKCNISNNEPVTQIRLAIKKNDVTIDNIRVTFQNGKTQNIAVNQDYSNGEKTEWFALKGLKDRCIQKIRVTGTPFHMWDDSDDGFHNPGHGPGGSIGFGNGNIDIDINFPGNNGGHHHPGPGHHNNNSFTVLQVIGLK